MVDNRDSETASVSSLDYASADRPPQTSRFIAIGVMSLVIGLFGLLINGALSFQLWGSAVQANIVAANEDLAAIRAASDRAAEAIAETKARANQPAALNKQQATDVISKVAKSCGMAQRNWMTGTPTEAERQKLYEMLCTPGQRLIDGAIPIDVLPADASNVGLDSPTQQVLAARIMGNGLVLRTGHRFGATEHGTYSQVIISSDGKLTFQDITSPAGRDVTTATGTSHELSYDGLHSSDPAVQAEAHQQRLALWLAVIAAVTSLLLSSLLIAAAIHVLMPTRLRMGVRLHWLYVGCKLVAAIFAAYAFAGAASAPDPGSPLTTGMQEFIAGVFGLAGCAYPLLLIMLLPSPPPTTTIASP